MRKGLKHSLVIAAALLAAIASNAQRSLINFNKGWKFNLGDDSVARYPNYNDVSWRLLTLPHDWSIEGSFSDKHPTTHNQAALPAGIGWYRKTFTVPATSQDKRVYINFDGVHRNSEVWINGQYLGKRPNGYISFRYELTPYLNFGTAKNVIAVKVDDSAQPTSRWYTGSGIYRNVTLLTTNKVAVDHWGSFVTTPKVSSLSATINIKTTLNSPATFSKVYLQTNIYDANGKSVANKITAAISLKDTVTTTSTDLVISNPFLWSIEKPYLYQIVTKVLQGSTVLDQYATSLGIRHFKFDAQKGFFLNGKPLKIFGTCEHHDLGALGAAVNIRAIERKLEILKAMGVNGIRTAHNPPAPEFLDLCDKMGFIVMDEAYDMWAKRKNRNDYHLDFKQWHKKDLEDMVKRDRNHPSIFIWSIGNEIREQFDSTGLTITKELADIVRRLDTTRPVTSALTENVPEKNLIYRSGALDVLGFNYKLDAYEDLPKRFPGMPIIATETSSALATRGHYDMPSDTNRLWPPDSKSKFTGNADLTVSAYDHVYAYWGSSHEAGWNAVKRNPYIAGIYVWSGFDFLGEPVPYPWPARSSYYGVIDLAGFPKDTYYMYQSEWTNKPVLHIFPHWNWERGKVVDVWAYYNNADEVELLLNDKSLGVKKKQGDRLHTMWRVNYEPGTLKAISRLSGKTVLTREIKTAGKPAKIQLLADRRIIKANGTDLSFITVRILDENKNIVPNASNFVSFKVDGEGFIAGVDNGLQTSMEPFKASYRKAFNGLCLAIIQSKGKVGSIRIEATSAGLQPASLVIQAKKQ
jgi:beta-galactosidase